MACDGHIDQQEIDEMKKMDKNTTYFGDVDLSIELDRLLKDLNKHGKKVVNDLFQELRETKLNPVQELLILEVALRIIHADEKIDENEIKFVKLLRGRLELYDEMIIERFGKDNLLFDKEYGSDIIVKETDFLNNLDFSDLEELKNLKLDNSNSN